MAKITRLREIRDKLMLSKAELARKAGISPLTIDRIEKGLPSRLETQRKILEALEFELSEKESVFGA